MSVFTQTLDGEDWHLTYDTEAKELSHSEHVGEYAFVAG